jgi:hypothetical protein
MFGNNFDRKGKQLFPPSLQSLVSFSGDYTPGRNISTFRTDFIQVPTNAYVKFYLDVKLTTDLKPAP